MKWKTGSVVLLAALVTVSGTAATITVPDDQPSIQAGIDAAVNGDVVQVQPGTYYEIIDFSGKAVSVESMLGPEVTIIDGQQQGSVVTFANGEGTDSILDGFTITGGYGTYVDPGYYHGGGVYALIADPTISNNIFTENEAFWGHGGAIYLYHADAKITGNMFTLNTSKYTGAGIYGSLSNVKVIGNTFSQNSAGWSGGGLSITSYGGTIEGNTFTGNVANDGGFGAIGFSAQDNPATISNNIITDNSCTGSDGAAIICSSDSQITISGNTISGNTGKGISCSQATVENNTISNNTSTGGYGGGVKISSGTVTGNLIEGNAAELGAGIYCGGGATVTNNIIRLNTASGYPDGYGGGICCGGSDLTTVSGNTIIDNQSADFGGGIACMGSANVELSNTILRGNQAPIGPEIVVGQSAGTQAVLNIDCSNVDGGQASTQVYPSDTLVWGAEMIDVPPFWCDPDAGDYRLAENCPCAPASQPVCGLIGGGEVGCGPRTVSAELICSPSSGTVPLQVWMTVKLGNPDTGAFRRSAGRIDLTLANGAFYANWRAGFTNLAPGETNVISWLQNIPGLATCIGDNHFHFFAEDVTPPPYNQPPYPAAGDTASDNCTVTASVWDGIVEMGLLADATVMAGMEADTNFGHDNQLEIRSTGSSGAVRKGYIVLDVSELAIHPEISSATLRMRQLGWTAGSVLRVFGVTDNDDWNPGTLPELSITYNNAPRNDTTNAGFLDEGFGDGARVRVLGEIDAYTAGWKEVDITSYVWWALGHDPAYGFSPADDDGLVTILIRENTIPSEGTAEFDSMNTQWGDPPLLRVVVTEP